MKAIREYGEINVLCSGVPADFLNKTGLSRSESSHHLFDFVKDIIASKLKGSDVYFVLVPGAMSNMQGPKSIVRNFVLLLIFRILYMSGVKIIRLGASTDEISSTRGFVDRLKSSSMYFLGLRDHISLSHARNARLENTGYCPDMAWMLPYFPSRVEETVSKILTLSFRADDNQHFDAIASYAILLLDLIDPECNWQIQLVVQVSRDSTWMDKLFSILSNRRPVTLITSSDGEAKLFESYGKSQLVISNRLHVLLFAASRGAKIIGLLDKTRNPKIVGIFKDSNLSHNIMFLDDGNPELKKLLNVTPVSQQTFEKHSGLIRDKINDILSGETF